MDLNHAFLSQQIQRSLADTANSRADRDTHEKLARMYELEIERRSGGRIMFRTAQTAAKRSAETELVVVSHPIRIIGE